MQRRNLKEFFPSTDDNTTFRKIKYDYESLHYISKRNDAEVITSIIIKHLEKIQIKPNDTVLTDATAGIGGNTISFGMMFKSVNAIEIDNDIYKYLMNNTSVYHLNNIIGYNDDCVKVLPTITTHNVIFMDPPWGGKNYKKVQNIKLLISGIPLEKLCLDIFDKTKMAKCPDIVALKLPLNYDIKFLFDQLNDENRIIHLYSMDKMHIIIIEHK